MELAVGGESVRDRGTSANWHTQVWNSFVFYSTVLQSFFALILRNREYCNYTYETNYWWDKSLISLL